MNHRLKCKIQNPKTSRSRKGDLGFGNEFLDTTPKVQTMKKVTK